MWVKNLIPAMFPFFIIADILINYNITNYISNFFKRVCKHLFGRDAALEVLKNKRNMWWMSMGITVDNKESISKILSKKM